MVDNGLKQPHGRLRLPDSAIEAIHELIIVLLKVAVQHAMKGSGDKPFEIADHDVHHKQPLVDFLWRRELLGWWWCDSASAAIKEKASVRIVALHPDYLRQPLRRDAAFVDPHQVDCSEPLGQRHLAVVENGADGRRNLVAALRTLAQMAVFQHLRLVVAVFGAGEAVAPALMRQSVLASVFCGVFPAPRQKVGGLLFHEPFTSANTI